MKIEFDPFFDPYTSFGDERQVPEELNYDEFEKPAEEEANAYRRHFEEDGVPTWGQQESVQSPLAQLITNFFYILLEILL